MTNDELSRAFIQANAIFTATLGFVISEMIRSGDTTDARAKRCFKEIRAVQNRHGSSPAAGLLIDMLEASALGEPPAG